MKKVRSLSGPETQIITGAVSAKFLKRSSLSRSNASLRLRSAASAMARDASAFAFAKSDLARSSASKAIPSDMPPTETRMATKNTPLIPEGELLEGCVK